MNPKNNPEAANPIAGKKQGVNSFSPEEQALFEEEFDLLACLLLPERYPPDPAQSGMLHNNLHLVTASKLTAYLQERGWVMDEAGSDEASRRWKKADGSVCSIHTKDKAESLAKDIEAIALGEKVSALQVLVELLVLRLCG